MHAFDASFLRALSGVATDPGHAVVHAVKIEIRANAKVWKRAV